MEILQKPREETLPRVDAEITPHCDCVHENLTDGLHHYLNLPGGGEGGSITAIDESLERSDDYYIAVTFVESYYCFLRPTWGATFRGASEAGEIPPSLRLLCDWCRNHWSNAPSVDFRKL